MFVNNKKILIIDDDRDFLKLTTRVLTREGYNVAQAITGKGGLRQVLEMNPGVIILDRVLPDMDGLDVCRQIRANPGMGDVFIILVSGIKVDVHERRLAIESGADDYLTKPFSPAELISHLQIAFRLRRAELEALRSSVIEQVNEVVFITDLNGKIVYVNPYFETLTGYTAAEAIGQTPRLLKSDLQTPEVFQEIWTTITAGQIWEGDLANRCKDGSLFDAHTHIFPLKNKQGQIVNYVSVQRDISARKQLEREKEAVVTIAAAIRQAEGQAGLLPVILDEVLSLFNADAAAIGLIEEMTGDTVYEIHHREQTNISGFRQPQGTGVTGEIITTKKPYITSNLLADSKFTHPEVIGDAKAAAAVPLFVQTEVIGVLWLGRRTEVYLTELQLLGAIGDMVASAINRTLLHEKIQNHAVDLEKRVTERTQALANANIELKQLDDLKSKFVADVSHELRSPIANMQVYLDLLQMGSAEKRDQYHEILQGQLHRLSLLVEDILDLSRLEAVELQKQQFETVDLNELVAEVVSAHAIQAEKAGLNLAFIPNENLPQVLGLPDHLTRVFTNLIANAINYTTVGSVVVRTICPNGNNQACVQIEDTGIGISPQEITRLFARFYRGETEMVKQVPGTGLGLTIVKEIVEGHNGSIDVKSMPGKGSSFSVYLPTALSQ